MIEDTLTEYVPYHPEDCKAWRMTEDGPVINLPDCTCHVNNPCSFCGQLSFPIVTTPTRKAFICERCAFLALAAHDVSYVHSLPRDAKMELA